MLRTAYHRYQVGYVVIDREVGSLRKLHTLDDFASLLRTVDSNIRVKAEMNECVNNISSAAQSTSSVTAFVDSVVR
jgi:hypothetical protein